MAAAYLLTVSLWMPNSLAMPLRDKSHAALPPVLDFAVLHLERGGYQRQYGTGRLGRSAPFVAEAPSENLLGIGPAVQVVRPLLHDWEPFL